MNKEDNDLHGDDGKHWNSARSWCSFALGGVMERVQTQFLICRKSGCSFGSVGLIFAHVVRFWDFGPALGHVGTILGSYWTILGRVGTRSGSCWAILRVVVGLYLGLEHFSVVEFGQCKAFAKNTINTNKNTIFIVALRTFLMFFWCSFVSFPLGHAVLRLCWPFASSCWAIFEPCWVVVMSYWVMLGNVGPMLGHVGECWAIVEPFWAMLSHFGPSWREIRLMLSHFRLFLGSCWHFSLDLGISVSLSLGPGKAAFAQNTVNTKNNAIFGLSCWCFWCYSLFSRVFPFLWGMLTEAMLALSQAHVEQFLCMCVCATIWKAKKVEKLWRSAFLKYQWQQFGNLWKPSKINENILGFCLAILVHFGLCPRGRVWRGGHGMDHVKTQFLWVSWWLWHGMRVLIWVDISMVCCIFGRRHNTQYQTIQHTCGPWLLQRFSSPYRRSLHKEKTVCVACHQVKKCKSHPKQTMKQPKTTLHFLGQLWFFVRVFYLTEWLKIFCKFFRILLAAGVPKCKLHL